MSENTHWGYHLVLNAGSCNKEAVMSAGTIYDFCKELVERIDMVAFGEPQIVKFGTGNKAGYTLVQLIETSNICAHFCDDTGDMYLDVFSCKPYSVNIVIELVEKYFRPERLGYDFLERQA